MGLLTPGQVVQLEDEDYLYGSGHLTFSVLEVGEQYRERDVVWVRLTGYRVHSGGRPWGPKREISAKVSRIRLAPTAGEPLPLRPPREAVPEGERIPSTA